MSTTTRLALAVYLLVGSMLCSSARADSTKNLEKQLFAAVNGQIYWLNKPYIGEKLEFDSTGQLIGNTDTGSPAVNGLLQVTHLSMGKDSLRITGWRVVAVLSKLSGMFTLVVTDQPIRVTIHVAHSLSNESEALTILKSIFSSGDPNKRLAGFWKPTGYAPPSGSTNAGESPQGVAGVLGDKPVYGGYGGKGVTAPKIVRSHSPNHYPPHDLTGQTTVQMIIDEQGKPTLLIADHPEDPLQTEAAAVFFESSFTPATKDGRAVAILITLGMDYRAPQ
jgi:hypothetical protein